MPWWRRPVLFSVALQLSVKFCTVKVEWSAEIKEEKCCLLQLHAYVHVYVCLCVWVCVCTGTYAYIYMGVWVRVCLMLLLLQFVEGLSWFGVYFIGGLLVFFFSLSLMLLTVVNFWSNLLVNEKQNTSQNHGTTRASGFWSPEENPFLWVWLSTDEHQGCQALQILGSQLQLCDESHWNQSLEFHSLAKNP